MKKFILIILIIIPLFLKAQNELFNTVTKVTIDSTLFNPFFSKQHIVVQITGGKSKIQQRESGKLDSSYVPEREQEIIMNCKINDLEKSHAGFDNCISYFQYDTLIIQFQNNGANGPMVAEWDKMILHVYKDVFYAEYVYTSQSSYRLTLKAQNLTLNKLGFKRGDRIWGEISIQFIPDRKINKSNLIVFKGPFDTIIE